MSIIFLEVSGTRCRRKAVDVRMKIGLASYEFINRDMEFNISQIEKASEAVQGSVELLCFGEAFLQGFDALTWKYGEDMRVAVASDSDIMKRICDISLRYKVDLMFGYTEKSGQAIYSSCAVIERGELIHNYRRISQGWKERRIADGHYREGTDTGGFQYRGHRIQIALCGDLWDFPEKFHGGDLLVWPVYVDFTTEYAAQAHLASDRTVMVNSISGGQSCGGAFYFCGGRTEQKLSQGTEGIMVLEI